MKKLLNERTLMSQNFELPDYENISAEEMASSIGLNVKHIPVLVGSFTEESKKLIEEFEEAISSSDYEAIEHAAHSLKGSAGNLRLNEMHELSKEVEFAARAKTVDYPYDKACASLKKAIYSISL